ncbi:MAG: hypothetical protein AAGI22_28135 [Planctomycetota bacterium]
MSDPEPARGRPSAALVGAALAVALVPFALLVWRFDFVCDDAYITFRYARNFAEGRGLVYNPGVEPPVEGYSEFLWAVLLRLGFDAGLAPEAVSRALSIAAGAGLVVLCVFSLARRFAPSPVALLGASLVLGCAPPLAVWSTGGMATAPAALLAVGLFVVTYRPLVGGASTLRRGALIGLLAALLALVRADAALLVALVLSPPIVVGLVQRRPAVWRPALIGASIGAAAFLAHVAWRMSFYGDWVPNTARVKLGFSARAAGRGLDYVVSAFLSMPGLAIAFAGALVGAWCARKRIGPATASGTVVLVAGVTLYAISTGGDFMCFARFLLPAIPFAALGFGAALHLVEARSRAAAVGLAAATALLTVLAAFDVHVVPESARQAFHFRHNQTLSGVAPSTSEVEQWRNMRGRAEVWAETGRALARHAPPEASVVFGAVGAIGYFSNLFVYDRNGLVTREVALREPHATLRSPGHDKVVPPEYFLRYDPTYLDVGIWPEANFPPPAMAGVRLLRLGPAERPGWILWARPGA